MVCSGPSTGTSVPGGKEVVDDDQSGYNKPAELDDQPGYNAPRTLSEISGINSNDYNSGIGQLAASDLGSEWVGGSTADRSDQTERSASAGDGPGALDNLWYSVVEPNVVYFSPLANVLLEGQSPSLVYTSNLPSSRSTAP